MSKTIGFLGPQGTFGEEAAILYKRNTVRVPYPSHEEVIQAVFNRRVEQGVVARENSIGGSVDETVDALIHGPIGITMTLAPNGQSVRVHPNELMVCGEVQLSIVQCLYLKPGVARHEVEVVYSHAQGLTQCRNFLRKEFPNAKLAPQVSTVAGVQAMLQSEVPAAAIAPRRAKDYYPVHLAENGIEDNHANKTRFLVIGRYDDLDIVGCKTSICFMVPGDEKPGSFDRVSQLFAIGGVNKLLIESRAAKTELGKYVFLMDIDGQRQDKVILRILELLVIAGLTTTLKVLGSYHKWRNGE